TLLTPKLLPLPLQKPLLFTPKILLALRLHPILLHKDLALRLPPLPPRKLLRLLLRLLLLPRSLTALIAKLLRMNLKTSTIIQTRVQTMRRLKLLD
ncbi:hypothetical protein DXG01_013808, partial [Tephrocybe rancida]